MPKTIGVEVEYEAGDFLAGKYRVVRRLGGGAMGTVYEVTQAELERTCAIKVMKASLAGDASLVARFRAEAQTHSLLEGSGHICTVFDFGTLENGTPFYAMTLLRGRPLSELIHYYYVLKRQPFPPRTALAIAHQICKALAFAHQRGVVHCDIKPENLFVHVVGQSWWVLVVDFGIAHRMDSTARADDIFIGTPPFAPREQVLGRDPSPKMDVHAVGVVLFILLTGRAPFAHLGAKGLAAVLSPRPPEAPPLSQFGSYPRELTSLVARCLSHHADERPDAHHLAARFHELAHELPETVPPPAGQVAGQVKPALTAPITPSETPLAISRWQQDQDKWDRTQRRVQRQERLRWLGKRAGLALAIVCGVAGASSTGVLLFRKPPQAPPPTQSSSNSPSPSPESRSPAPTLAPVQVAPPEKAPEHLPEAVPERTREPLPVPKDVAKEAPNERTAESVPGAIPAASASQSPAPKASTQRAAPNGAEAPAPKTRIIDKPGPQRQAGDPGDLETTVD